MQTTAIYVMNLCVPCNCHCRYCLLSWSNQVLGIDYHRSEQYARRFYDWIKEHRPDLDFVFFFGYSMEHPDLPGAIDFMKSIGSPGGRFLQFDGMKMRNDAEIEELLNSIMEHGIELIDLTFYGTREYHDKFAGRAGDFDYMMRILGAANKLGLSVQIGIPVTHENADQVDELLELFEGCTIAKRYLFVPHAEGRGKVLNTIRFCADDYEALSDKAKALLNVKNFKTEAEWVRKKEFVTYENRVVTVALTPENIEGFENMSFEETIVYLEKLDEDYYKVIPSLETLVEMYGDENSRKYYSQRDLYLNYQRRYIEEYHLDIYDINDERQCFSRRY